MDPRHKAYLYDVPASIVAMAKSPECSTSAFSEHLSRVGRSHWVVPSEGDRDAILNIMDSVLRAEVAFYDGTSLGHSVFMCWFMHSPKFVLDINPLLGCYLFGVLYCCQMYHSISRTVDVFEEEDFHANLYHVHLEDHLFKLEQVVELLEIQEKTLNTHDDEKKDEFVSRLLSRVQFRRSWLRVLTLLTHANNERRVEALTGTKKDLVRIQELVKSSCFQSEAVSKEDWAIPETWPVAFDPALTKVLIHNAPPRHPDISSFPRVVEFFSSLTGSLLNAVDFVKIPSSRQFSDYDSALSFFWRLNDSEHPVSFSRFVCLLVFGTEKNFLHGDSLRNSVRRSLASSSCAARASLEAMSALPKKSEEFNILEAFLDRLVQPICQIFRLLAQNRSRQHSKIPRIIADWVILQNDAATVDQCAMSTWVKFGLARNQLTTVYQHPFFAWVFDITSKLIAHHVFLSFELNLVGMHEMPVLYWFLDQLLDMRLQTRYYSTLQSFELVMAADAKKSLSGHKSAKKKTSSKEGKSLADFRPSDPLSPSVEYFVLEALRDISRGTQHSFEALRRKGLQVSGSELFEFGSAEIRYLQRVGWMQQLPQPPCPKFEKFVAEVLENKELSFESLQKDASDSFKKGKTLLESVLKNAGPLGGKKSSTVEFCLHSAAFEHSFLKAMVKVCVMNSVFLLSLNRCLEKLGVSADDLAGPLGRSDGIRLNVDFSVSRWFPVFSISKQ
eukprot:TRINITY_DN53525_c0_g1_i1.p1 TRINITY_DN53525_c0_g1~~TRINITY_DN53525_c0_g1_i1.p1  ORF type:complete len:792 (-),score=167.93 TRINITY_DN53525_c0_g1_i1:41-2221(-)